MAGFQSLYGAWTPVCVELRCTDRGHNVEKSTHCLLRKTEQPTSRPGELATQGARRGGTGMGCNERYGRTQTRKTRMITSTRLIHYMGRIKCDGYSTQTCLTSLQCAPSAAKSSGTARPSTCKDPITNSSMGIPGAPAASGASLHRPDPRTRSISSRTIDGGTRNRRRNF